MAFLRFFWSLELESQDTFFETKNTIPKHVSVHFTVLRKISRFDDWTKKIIEIKKALESGESEESDESNEQPTKILTILNTTPKSTTHSSRPTKSGPRTSDLFRQNLEISEYEGKYWKFR